MARQRDELSEQGRELYLFLVKFVERWGYQPSIREMAGAMHIDKRAVHDRLSRLSHLGLVILPKPRRERGLVLPHVRFQAVFCDPE